MPRKKVKCSLLKSRHEFFISDNCLFRSIPTWTLIASYSPLKFDKIKCYNQRVKAWVYQSTRPCLHCVMYSISWRMIVYIYCITTAGNYISSQLAGQPLSGQPVWYGKGRRYGPSFTYKITPAGSLSSSQPGGPPCWVGPLAFGLIGHNI